MLNTFTLPAGNFGGALSHSRSDQAVASRAIASVAPPDVPPARRLAAAVAAQRMTKRSQIIARLIETSLQCCARV